MKFLSALAADGTIPDVEGIITSNLSTAFDSLKQNVTDSMASQEQVLAAVQVCEIEYLKIWDISAPIPPPPPSLPVIRTTLDCYNYLLQP